MSRGGRGHRGGAVSRAQARPGGAAAARGVAPLPRAAARSVAPLPPAAARAAVVLALGLFLSCTGAPPETTRAELSVVYVDDLEIDAAYEALSVRAHVQDADGIDDVERLHVTHDESGLVWTVSEERWSRQEEGGAEVFVVSGLATPDGRPLPRGDYRIIAVDAAGYSSEITAALRAPVVGQQQLRFPVLEIRGDQVTVSGDFELVVLQGYGGDGRIVGEVELLPGEERAVGEIPWLSGVDGDGRLVLQAVIPGRGIEVLRGPYRR